MSPSLPAARPHLATRAVRPAAGLDPDSGAIAPPIHQTATFAQDAVGRDRGHTYSRGSNPTVVALEERLAALDDVRHALAFRSGLAAIAALAIAVARPGQRVVLSRVCYGGTVRLLRDVLGPFGVEAEFVDSTNERELTDALRRPARLVLVESPANPTLVLTDLRLAARLAREAGALFAVDNTFLTPVLQSVFELGADVAIYSTTKFVEGHNATLGGALVTDDDELRERLHGTRTALGSIQAPLDAWLTLRGVQTLPLRVREHARNAAHVARALEGHPSVRRVLHPDLESFPQRELARRQQSAGGGVLALELAGGEGSARELASSLRLATLAESLGGTETLVTHPATMTHAQWSPEERAALGIAPSLLRLSVGLEDPRDLVADLVRALDSLRQPEVLR